MDDDGSGNKRLTEKSDKIPKKKQHIEWGKNQPPVYQAVLNFLGTDIF